MRGVTTVKTHSEI